MWPNLKPSQRATLAGVVNPQLTTTTITSGWVPAAKGQNFLAMVAVGVMAAAHTVDAKIRQATDGSGTGVKDVSGKAITQMVKATDDNKQAFINVKQDDLDVANSFTHIELSITVGGSTDSSPVFGAILEFDPRYGPAGNDALTSLKETVG